MVDSLRQCFYRDAMRTFDQTGIPFLVGGAYAMNYHAGVERDSKDFDVFCKRSDLIRIEDAFGNSPHPDSPTFELTYPSWLGKVVDKEKRYVDVIFNSSNTLISVDNSWFSRAEEGIVLARPALVLPAEEMLASKTFVLSKDCYHGADVNQILRAKASMLDWDRVLELMGDHWQVLLSQLVMFSYAFPNEAQNIPQSVWSKLLTKQRTELRSPKDERICRGENLSPLLGEYDSTYKNWGYKHPQL